MKGRGVKIEDPYSMLAKQCPKCVDIFLEKEISNSALNVFQIKLSNVAGDYYPDG